MTCVDPQYDCCAEHECYRRKESSIFTQRKRSGKQKCKCANQKNIKNKPPAKEQIGIKEKGQPDKGIEHLGLGITNKRRTGKHIGIPQGNASTLPDTGSKKRSPERTQCSYIIANHISRRVDHLVIVDNNR